MRTMPTRSPATRSAARTVGASTSASSETAPPTTTSVVSTPPRQPGPARAPRRLPREQLRALRLCAHARDRPVVGKRARSTATQDRGRRWQTPGRRRSRTPPRRRGSHRWRRGRRPHPRAETPTQTPSRSRAATRRVTASDARPPSPAASARTATPDLPIPSGPTAASTARAVHTPRRNERADPVTITIQAKGAARAGAGGHHAHLRGHEGTQARPVTCPAVFALDARATTVVSASTLEHSPAGRSPAPVGRGSRRPRRPRARPGASPDPARLPGCSPQ